MKEIERMSVSAGLRRTTSTISDFESSVFYPCDYHKHFSTNEQGELFLCRGGKLLDNVSVLTIAPFHN
jgi:hypothetical protein